MSKRANIACHMAVSKRLPSLHTGKWLDILYALEQEGYQVVKTSETAEFQGLRNAQEGKR